MCVQDWAKDQAPPFRCLLIHTLDLYKRAATSRSPKVKVLKEALAQLLSSAGWMGAVCHRGRSYIILHIYIYIFIYRERESVVLHIYLFAI